MTSGVTSGVNGVLAVSAEERAVIAAILARLLPSGVKVHAFGSRVHGPCKPWSDLDLALDGGVPIPLGVMAELAEAFDESALPWKVDLVDRATVSEGFARIIDAGRITVL